MHLFPEERHYERNFRVNLGQHTEETFVVIPRVVHERNVCDDLVVVYEKNVRVDQGWYGEEGTFGDDPKVVHERNVRVDQK